MKMPDRKMTVTELFAWIYENDYGEYLNCLGASQQSDEAVEWEILTEVMYRGTYNEWILDEDEQIGSELTGQHKPIGREIE